jgi:hypothetical protein
MKWKEVDDTWTRKLWAKRMKERRLVQISWLCLTIGILITMAIKPVGTLHLVIKLKFDIRGAFSIITYSFDIAIAFIMLSSNFVAYLMIFIGFQYLKFRLRILIQLVPNYSQHPTTYEMGLRNFVQQHVEIIRWLSFTYANNSFYFEYV